MLWKSDPNKLALKIHERIISEKRDVTYSELEAMAKAKNIDLNVFDAALARLHRSKKVKQRMKGGDIMYTAIAKPKKKEKPRKSCLVQITLISSPYFEAQIYPLSDFKREKDVLYRSGAVVTPGYGENRIWFCPTDIGLENDDLPLPLDSETINAFPQIPDWDLSWMFLRPDEMLEFKARAKNMPLHMMKKIHKKK